MEEVLVCILKEENERKKVLENKILVYSGFAALRGSNLPETFESHSSRYHEIIKINHLWSTQMYLYL